MNLFDKSPLAWKKIPEWSQREEEFIRRAALALIACLAWHDKRADDTLFVKLMPVIRKLRDGRTQLCEESCQLGFEEYRQAQPEPEPGSDPMCS